MQRAIKDWGARGARTGDNARFENVDARTARVRVGRMNPELVSLYRQPRDKNTKAALFMESIKTWYTLKYTLILAIEKYCQFHDH